MRADLLHVTSAFVLVRLHSWLWFYSCLFTTLQPSTTL